MSNKCQENVKFPFDMGKILCLNFRFLKMLCKTKKKFIFKNPKDIFIKNNFGGGFKNFYLKMCSVINQITLYLPIFVQLRVMYKRL